MSQTQITKNPENVVFNALLLLSSMGLLVFVLKYCAYGFDFTDEGFYLAWISNPFIYDFSTSQFGFIYHPLYALMEESITGVRRANILLAWTLGSMLTYSILTMDKLQLNDPTFNLLSMSLAIASSSLVIFSEFLITPSYDSLVVQAALIVSLGLVIIVKGSSRGTFKGWIVMGAGGWLSFMAKPTTAAVLAITVLTFLLATRSIRLKPLLASAATATGLLLASALVIDGSIAKFVDRLVTAANYIAIFDPRYSLSGVFRSLDISFTGAQKLLILAGSGIFILGILVPHLKKNIAVAYSLNFLFFLGITASIAASAQLAFEGVDLGRWGGKTFLGPVLAATTFSVFSKVFQASWVPHRNHVCLAIWFLLLPLMLTFGSNGAIFDRSSVRSIFWVLAGIVLVLPYARQQKSWHALFPTALMIQFLVIASFQGAVKSPYRQSDLRLESELGVVKIQSSELKIHKSAVDYINTASSKSHLAGFEQGDPVIDLSGQSPGLLFAIGASNIGRPWFGGGYPGSFDYVALSLARVPCKTLAEAWILTEPDGPRSISNDVLKSFGADLSSNYDFAGSWMTSQGAGGYSEPRKQNFYKASLPERITAKCDALRLGTR